MNEKLSQKDWCVVALWFLAISLCILNAFHLWEPDNINIVPLAVACFIAGKIVRHYIPMRQP